MVSLVERGCDGRLALAPSSGASMFGWSPAWFSHLVVWTVSCGGKTVCGTMLGVVLLFVTHERFSCARLRRNSDVSHNSLGSRIFPAMVVFPDLAHDTTCSRDPLEAPCCRVSKALQQTHIHSTDRFFMWRLLHRVTVICEARSLWICKVPDPLLLAGCMLHIQ